MLARLRRMGPRPRTFGVAIGIGLLLSTAALARITVNGSPSTISQVVKAVWNGDDISLSNALPTVPGNVTRTGLTCVLPTYSTTASGTMTCTDQSGTQTTTTCAGGSACQILPANPNRKTFSAMNITPGSSNPSPGGISLGYAPSVAPGAGVGLSPPPTQYMTGGERIEAPAHSGPYFAAAVNGGTLFVVEGQ